MVTNAWGSTPQRRFRFKPTAAVALMLGVVTLHPVLAQGNGSAAGTGTGTAGVGAGTTGVGGGTTSPTGSNGTAPTATTAPGMSNTPGANNPANNGNSAPGATTTNSAGTQSSTVPGGSVATQTNTSPIYDLSRTVTEAIAASSDLQTQKRNVQIDKKRSDEAASAGRPSVGATGSATRFDKPTTISFGAGAPVTVLYDHTETLALNLSERLDVTGQIRAASNQAQLQSLADQFIVKQIENGRILRAKTIYFNLLRAEHQVAVATAARSTAVQQQTLAVKLNQQQIGQKIDVLRANTQVATTEQALTQAQNSLDIARVSFNDLVGRPLGSPVELSDVPGANVGIDVTAGPNTIVGDQTFTPAAQFVPDASPIDIDSSIQTGLNNRPEVLAAAVNVRVAETGVKLARSGLEPTFAINAAGDYYPTTSFQTPRKRVAEITATITVPLYDGGATRDRVQEARLRTQNAETTLGSTKSDVALDIRQAYLNLMTASHQIDSANTALQQAIAARQLAQIRYAGQVGLYLEVTDAQSALVQAETNQLNAVYDYLTARAQFENALGTPSYR